MLRVPAAVLALSAVGLAACPAQIGKGDKGRVKATMCGAGSCGKSIELPLSEEFTFCNPCTGKNDTEASQLWYNDLEGRYTMSSVVDPMKETSTVCGTCSETGLSLECPPSKCPAKIGNGKVTWTGCGDDVCARPIQVPLGEEFTYCDPCTGEEGDLKFSIEVKDQTHYTISGGGRSLVLECGKCDMEAQIGLSCPSDVPEPSGDDSPIDNEGDEGLSGGAVAGIVIGCLVLVAAVAGGVYILKKKKAQPETSVNYSEIPHHHN